MADKSPRQSMTKKTGKSIKEKRAAKRDDSGHTPDDVLNRKKR